MKYIINLLKEIFKFIEERIIGFNYKTTRNIIKVFGISNKNDNIWLYETDSLEKKFKPCKEKDIFFENGKIFYIGNKRFIKIGNRHKTRKSK